MSQPDPASPPSLVIDLCRAVLAATAHRGSSDWASVDAIEQALDVDFDRLDEAIDYGVQHGLLKPDGQPAQRLALTRAGIVLAFG